MSFKLRYITNFIKNPKSTIEKKIIKHRSKKFNAMVMHKLESELSHIDLNFSSAKGGEKQVPPPRSCHLPREVIDEDFLPYLKHLNDFFVCIKSNNSVSLCIPQSKKLTFAVALILEIYKNDYSLVYIKNKRQVKLTNLRDFLQLSTNHQRLAIEVVDQRSLASFHYFLEFWNECDGYILAPRPNPISCKVWNRTLEKHNLLKGGELSYLSDVLVYPPSPTFDVDYVYTWVNSNDPDWQEMYSKHKPEYKNDSNSNARFRSRDELLYSLRALEEFAPWLRKIFIVSNCKPPEWLDIGNEKIQWVYHEEIFDAHELPTFSSHSIESKLHKIKGLSNYFIYSNDDFMIARPVSKSDFFLSNGICKVKFEQYGNVTGDLMDGEPDYLNAARNCQTLIEDTFQVSPTQLHTHSPQALRKDLIEEMELKYPEQFQRTGSNKFRSITDIAVTGFLFHHYAVCSGNGINDATPTKLIQPNHNFTKIFSEFITTRDNCKFLSFCINDGGDSEDDNQWNKESYEFLETFFPKKSKFEN